jgi:hypothetical protein
LFALIVAIITLFLLPHWTHSTAEAEAKQKVVEGEKKKPAAEEQKKKLAAAEDLKTASSEQAAKGKASDEQATTDFVTIHWSRLFFNHKIIIFFLQ